MCIILSILPSRCTIPTTHCNQARCTSRKCAIFGVCCEGLPHQIYYLIDEASDTGKGANTVVSLLHHFLAHHALGEVHLHLHADNCAGQNKNKTFLQYCAWRVMSGLHQSVTMSFMLVGHTKFAPDWCFGLLKQRFRRTFVSSLQDLVDVVNTSENVNVSQLVGGGGGGGSDRTYIRLGLLSWGALPEDTPDEIIPSFPVFFKQPR